MELKRFWLIDDWNVNDSLHLNFDDWWKIDTHEIQIVDDIERYNNGSNYTKPTAIYNDTSGTDDRIAEVVSFISEIR